MTGTRNIRVELAEDELRAVLDVVGKEVSASLKRAAPGSTGDPILYMAERKLDSALLAREEELRSR